MANSGRIAAMLILGGILVSGSAWGQSGGAERAASAEALFREAKGLMEDGNYALACPKLEASQRLDQAVGTLLNLAVCHEAQGKTASAWAEYLRAASMARRKQQPAREKYARRRAMELEPKLVRMAFAVAEEALVEGLEVRRDGLLQESASWATATPVDPGTHVVTALAPGKKEWRTTVEASGEGKTVTVDVPVLEDLPPEPEQPASDELEKGRASAPATEPKPSEPVAVSSSGANQRTLGILFGGVGVAGLAVGSIFGLQANSKWNDADCPDNRCPTPEQQDRAEDAKRFADVSTWSFAGGGALLAAGTVLWLTASDGPPSREVAQPRGMELRMEPSAGKGSAGVIVRGRF